MGGWHKLQNSQEIIGIALCELPASRVPIGGFFQNFSFTFRVPQYFLALARKVNDLRRFS